MAKRLGGVTQPSRDLVLFESSQRDGAVVSSVAFVERGLVLTHDVRMCGLQFRQHPQGTSA